MTEYHDPARGQTAAAENFPAAAPNQRRGDMPTQGKLGNSGSAVGLS